MLGTNTPALSSSLRIIHVNEAAQLNPYQLAALKSLVAGHGQRQQQHKRRTTTTTLVTLGGNFMGGSPSISSSSLSSAAALVDLYKHVGVTHGCLGLYEANHVTATELSQVLDSDDDDTAGAASFVTVNTNASSINSHFSCSGGEQNTLTVPFSSVSLSQENNNSGRRSRKRICLLGLLSDNPTLYSVGGVCANEPGSVRPMLETVERFIEKNEIVDEEQYNLIIPLTHASWDENQTLANYFGGNFFPLILCGGKPNLGFTRMGIKQRSSLKMQQQQQQHSQQVWNQNGVLLVQPLGDVVAVVDITWRKGPMTFFKGRSSAGAGAGGGAGNKVTVSVDLVPLRPQALPYHPAVLERALAYQAALQQQQQPSNQRLFRVNRWHKHVKLLSALGLSSPGSTSNSFLENFETRSKNHSMNIAASALATLMRLGWAATLPDLDTVLLPADRLTGTTNIRGGGGGGGCSFSSSSSTTKTKTTNDGWFSWGDFEREMPTELLLTCVSIPGQVLQDLIIGSRGAASLVPAAEGDTSVVSFIHTCSNVQYNQATPPPHTIQSIRGVLFDVQKEYLVALPLEWLLIDDLEDGGGSHHRRPAISLSLEFLKPLTQWTLRYKSSVVCHEETARSTHELLRQAVCRSAWFLPGSLLDLRVHGTTTTHAGTTTITKEQMQRQLQLQISIKSNTTATITNGKDNRVTTTRVQNDVAQLVTEQILQSVARGNIVDNAADDTITIVNVMMIDPLVRDAVFDSQGHSLRTKELDELLSDCAADFVLADDDDDNQLHKVTKKIVQQFWVSLLGDAKAQQSLNEQIQRRYDSLAATISNALPNTLSNSKMKKSLLDASKSRRRHNRDSAVATCKNKEVAAPSSRSSSLEVELLEMHQPLVRRSARNTKMV